jgi:hypothetical protein
VSDFTVEDAEDYREALDGLPAELIELAVKRCIRNSTFFPQPAEIRAQIKEELADERRRAAEEWDRRRRDEAIEADRARYLIAYERPPRTPEEIADVEAKCAAMRAGAIKRVPADPADLDERPPQRGLPDIRASLAGWRRVPLPGQDEADE